MIQAMPRRDQPQPKPALANVPMSIRLTRVEREGLGLIADARLVSVGTLIREAIDDYLDRFEDASGQTLRQALEAEHGIAVEDFDHGVGTIDVEPDLGSSDR